MTLRAPLALLALVTLGACVSVPDLRGNLRGFASGGTGTGSAAGAGTGGAAVPSASEAESACMSAAREAGFDVRGVVGSAALTGDPTTAAGRNVVMRIVSGGRSLDLRCVYAYDSRSARIMTL